MPRKRKQVDTIHAAYPLTGAEVEAMFEEAAYRPPRPDRATCEEIAEFLSCQMPQYWEEKRTARNESSPSILTKAEERDRQKWFAALNVIRTVRPPACNYMHHPNTVQTFEDLEKALARVEGTISVVWGQEHRLILRPGVPRPQDWHVMGFVNMHVAREVLEECRGRAGTGRNSIAAHFTELAMARIGWRDRRGTTIGREAIAKHYAVWKRRQNDHEMPRNEKPP